MQALTQEEETILRLRFGGTAQMYTREEVAVLLGIPQPAVQQIEYKLLRKLRLSALGPMIKPGQRDWDEV